MYIHVYAHIHKNSYKCTEGGFESLLSVCSSHIAIKFMTIYGKIFSE